MQAKETRLQEIIEGTKQYVIPLFQRSYSWTVKEWNILWKDIEELADMEDPRVHFMGSIVNMPTISVPHGVAKYLLIDGQQRLTTIFIILAVLRNKARDTGNKKLSDEIHNTLLVNQYKEGNDYYKLLPTQIDRLAYNQIIDIDGDKKNPIKEAYSYFEKQIKKSSYELEKILKILTNSFSVVSIVLDINDNPYLVFESLNAKGRTLTQADLIKNYFFMRILQSEQDDMYKKYWLPMQESFEENEKLLPEYIRHYMMRKGGLIRLNDVYYELKDRVNVDNAISYLQDLSKYSQFYRNIIFPENEHNTKLKRSFIRLNRIKQTTAYPILLFFYGEFDKQKITQEEFVEILTSLENYLIRRFVCGYQSKELNKIFPTVYSAIHSYNQENIVESFRDFLSKRGYPKDSEFKSKLQTTKIYGSGDRVTITKFILESLEESYHCKEKIDTTNLTVEHIMPQTLSVWWQQHLGEDWEDVHDELLHTLGNLTLTGYNSELYNDDYNTKRGFYTKSPLELNRSLSDIHEWKREQIMHRSTVLADKAIEIWPYFGDNEALSYTEKKITGTNPYSLNFLGDTFSVKNWRDVFEITLNTLADLVPEKFEQIAKILPSYIGKDKNKFRAIRQLSNGYYIEVNQSAASIQKNCIKALQVVNLSSDDWFVNISIDGNSVVLGNVQKEIQSITAKRLNNNVKIKCVEKISQHFGKQLIRCSNSVYKTSDKSIGFFFAASKAYEQPHFERYWFGYRKKEELVDCREHYYVFGCQNEATIILLSEDVIEKHLQEMNVSVDNETGKIRHWHIVFTISKEKQVKWVLSKPEMHEIDITENLL